MTTKADIFVIIKLSVDDTNSAFVLRLLLFYYFINYLGDSYAFSGKLSVER